MSEAFYVRVGKVEERKVTFQCLTGFAGGLTDYANTRSFALMLLLDAKERAGDTLYLVRSAPPAVADAHLALAEKAAKAPSSLHKDAGNANVFEAKWHARHTPRFVERTSVLERYNDVGEEKLRETFEEISPLQDQGRWLFLEAAWARMHRFDLAVEVTDAKYLEHLAEGHLFATTAFDVWLESRPLPP
ncbi:MULTISPECIES: hypothetical protein [unclassified Myxococcus]|uniref:hypothetical protein n=1 Tax=unclassified Myxococcus TaxID=2648731 RepID=UPI00157A6CC7|nr:MULTISPECIES: hypothetical protein [unclassified Myxococcus]NTX38069.1 hypothetical protein [Myxococcus sp. CA033]NTX50852.1 hypothetical protein [Myxococcus sp. CA039A]